MDEKRREYMRNYMARKRAMEVSPDNLPVDVQPEPDKSHVDAGEARESTTIPDNRMSDSRGGQTLSKSDQLKDVDRPGWYIFGDTEREANCWLCGKKYTTRLEMGRFCSPKCRNSFLDSTFTRLCPRE